MTTIQDWPGRLGCGRSACRRRVRWTTCRSGWPIWPSAAPPNGRTQATLMGPSLRFDQAGGGGGDRRAGSCLSWGKGQCRNGFRLSWLRAKCRCRAVGGGHARLHRRRRWHRRRRPPGEPVHLHPGAFRRTARRTAGRRRSPDLPRTRGIAGGTPRRILSDATALTNDWQLAVTMGPHGAPEFFTDTDIDDLLGTAYGCT